MLDQLLKAMPFRQIGPSRGGRVVAVAGDPSNPAVFYFGAVCGGVFKTTDAGITWFNVSDGFFKTSSVGALAVSESDPNVIYAGMGEATIRTDVSYGDGVYKSTDAGKTWKHVGLSDTRHIGKIVVHPKNPDIVYVAALGHAFGETDARNEERGVFRSKDGGATWQRVLFKSERAGAVDITLDAQNPDILYASIWQTHRNFWELSSGGPDSGIWMTRDGGNTWIDISRNKGLEKLGLIGKIGVSASPAQAGRVYALIEAKDKPGLYRSDDFGETWQLVSDNGDLRRRPFYYMHVHADPQDADTVYVNNLDFHKSTDGGKTWTKIATPHGDNHGLWIDPKNNRRMIQGNDGGANVSFNGGETFSSIYNQLTGQFYHIAADDQFPYRIYATQQDNSSISVPSDTVGGAIAWSDCYVAGTGESGYIAVKPDDPNIVIVGAVGSSPGGLGALQKYDHRTKQIQLINIWPQPFTAVDSSTFKHRFPWTFPILFSPHDPNALYVCGDKVWRSTDLGHSWEAISPDLTRNDPTKLKMSGGPITPDTSGAEFYCTISTFRESLHEQGVFMAGTDDGRVHISRNGGETWKEITPKELPEWSFVRTVEPSPHDAGTWYLAATRYKLDDFRPYVFVTRNDGRTWKKITNGIPEDEFVRVIRADPVRKGLLYLGTERHLYVSLDDGEHWHRWSFDAQSGDNPAADRSSIASPEAQGETPEATPPSSAEGAEIPTPVSSPAQPSGLPKGQILPITPIYDLLVKGDDLIVGTHGRGLWILDDLSALRQCNISNRRGRAKAKGPSDTAPHLFTPGATYRILPDLFAGLGGAEGKSYGLGLGTGAIHIAQTSETGHVERTFLDAGAGRERGAIVYYTLPDGLPDDTNYALEFLDGNGNVVRRYAPKPADYDAWDDKQKSLDTGPWISTRAGVNRFVWNLRHTGATRVAGNKTAAEATEGPLVSPGVYTARLIVGDQTCTATFEVVNDPRVKTSLRDLQRQEKMLLKMRDAISRAHAAVNRLRDLRDQAQAWKKRADGHPDLAEAIDALVNKLDAIEDKLILPGDQKDNYALITPTRLNAAVGSLMSVVASADSKPTQSAQALFAEHAAEIDGEVAKLDIVIATDVAALNALIAQKGLPALA